MDPAELARGLAQDQKTIPARYLWDDAGSKLFERVSAHPDYYPSGREVAILQRAAGDIAALAGPRATLVEFGSAGSAKARILLDALDAPARYVGIDISPVSLRHGVQHLAADFPALDVFAICADYGTPLTLPARLQGSRILGFFPGIAIGNFEPEGASAFLSRARDMLGPESLLLVAIDSTSDAASLRAAYADGEQRMASFHLNLLGRLQRALPSAPPPEAFRHEIRIVGSSPLRVEAHLVAEDAAAWSVDGRIYRCRRGESILTDRSTKYGLHEFQAMAHDAGWSAVRHWACDRTRISVQLLRA